MNPDVAAFEKTLAGLPQANVRAGETVLSAGSKTGRLMILRQGQVAILKDGTEIAKVDEPGAVFGELSALLELPHTADVRAVTDCQFQVADAGVLSQDPAALLYVARHLARRLVATTKGLVELKKQIETGQSPGTIKKMLDSIEHMLRTGGTSFEPGI